MKAFNGYDEKRVSYQKEVLPKGAYVIKILDAKVETFQKGTEKEYSKIVLSFDIDEGEKKEFYKTDYHKQYFEDRKWRGVIRKVIPVDSDEDWKKDAFTRMIVAIKKSNPGFEWEWKEESLKGKIVGCLYRNKEWEMNGMTGWTTEPYQLIDAAKVRSGEFNLPKDFPLSKRNGSDTMPQSSKDTYTEIDASEEDLPF